MLRHRKDTIMVPTETEIMELICDGCSKLVDITTSRPFETSTNPIGWVGLNKDLETHRVHADLCPECAAPLDVVLQAADNDRKKRMGL